MRPLGYASFWFSRQFLLLVGSVLLWQEPFYYRLGNVFIHALAATAWFCLVREITGQTIVVDALPLLSAVVGSGVLEVTVAESMSTVSPLQEPWK